MSPLLEQFLGEARELLQNIAEKLMLLESQPGSSELMNELFRLVHTLKGSSGLFDFPEMTKVLHAGEDLMDEVRDNKVPYSRSLADQLLNAMDFVAMLLDEIEQHESIEPQHAFTAKQLTEDLRQLLSASSEGTVKVAVDDMLSTLMATQQANSHQPILSLPASISLTEAQRMALYRQHHIAESLYLIEYTPEEECFFKGEDPLFIARQVPSILSLCVHTSAPLPALDNLDPYRCLLRFSILSSATIAELEETFRYIPEQVIITAVDPVALIQPEGSAADLDIYQDFIIEAATLQANNEQSALIAASNTILELSGPGLLFSSKLRWILLLLELTPGRPEIQQALIASLADTDIPQWQDLLNQKTSTLVLTESHSQTGMKDQATFNDLSSPAIQIWQTQRRILTMPDTDNWLSGRLHAVGSTLAALLNTLGSTQLLADMHKALTCALDSQSSQPLAAWLDDTNCPFTTTDSAQPVNSSGDSSLDSSIDSSLDSSLDKACTTLDPLPPATAINSSTEANVEVENKDVKFGRRAEDAYVGPKTLKVDQIKIDILMSLIGEMVVSKNSLPYLASRAENQYGNRELARDIKNQYAVINRIAEEMQDAIMQVRMMPVSYVFQRFPRLVRDISRRIGKEVNLVLEGEETEADKNIIEALADPLMHIVRNSLDHGIETIETRKAVGKPVTGTLKIKASQESDSVLIEISDDGKGINPDIIKRKAYEKGIIDEALLERISDQDAINLIFAAGFSTAEAVSDLSGRGVGMDVVRSAVEQVNGSIKLSSEAGKGTLIQLLLPLSMAVKSVLIVESHKQVFGIPMELVVETVRVASQDIRTIKNKQAAVLRNRVVPLSSLNELLALTAPQKMNDEHEYATLVIRHQGEQVGILVDDFMETVDIILKPMSGVLSSLTGYSGTALLGDGTVLMVLNPRELL